MEPNGTSLIWQLANCFACIKIQTQSLDRQNRFTIDISIFSLSLAQPHRGHESKVFTHSKNTRVIHSTNPILWQRVASCSAYVTSMGWHIHASNHAVSADHGRAFNGRPLHTHPYGVHTRAPYDKKFVELSQKQLQEAVANNTECGLWLNCLWSTNNSGGTAVEMRLMTAKRILD